MASPETPERGRRRIERAVERFMAANDLWPSDCRLLVGVSGGPDSTALLLVLASLAPARGVALTAAYFDHRLRGEAASRAERAAVAALCQDAGVPLVRGAADVRALARQKRCSLEEAARQARYAFLADAARRSRCNAVAVGHTEDDQAETVLMHVLRGAGLAGLAGIAARARWPLPDDSNLQIVRPLLALTRADAEAYCATAGITPLADESNRSPAFLRNRLRNEALPYLRRFNPRLNAALTRLAAAARDSVDYVDAAAAAYVGRDGDAVVLDRAAITEAPPALRRQAIRAAVVASVGDLSGFSQRHYAAIERLLTGGRGGDAVDLPRGLRATIRRGDLRLGRPEAAPARLPAGCAALTVPGEASLGSWRLRASCDDRPGEAKMAVEVDAEAAGSRLWLRRRRPGDRFQPLGMQAPKKLQDFLVDSHVPREERDVVPIVGNERGIVWVGGLRIAEWARPRPGQRVVGLGLSRAERP